MREAFQCVKQVGYVCFQWREGIKNGNVFLLRKNDNNFVLQLFVSGWRNFGSRNWQKICEKGILKKEFGMLSGLD